MAQNHLIGKFVPPRFERSMLDLSDIEQSFGQQLAYAANGRSALYRILSGGPGWKKILLPVYLCATVLIPLRKLGIEPVFYDIDPADLNPDLSSLLYMAEKHNASVALFPSLYGNAANLAQAEIRLKERDIFLIDDAAQSLGATLDGRQVGSFGDAGFFSVGPGKPLAGHMGAFFWTTGTLVSASTHHDLLHRIKWIDYWLRRVHAYNTQSIPFFHKGLEIATILVAKLADESLDDIAPFEVEIIGGLLQALRDGAFAFRQRQADTFARRFGSSDRFRVVAPLRGKPSSHKIVLHFASASAALVFRSYAGERKIYTGDGYPLLSTNLAELPEAARIDGQIVELPIEDDGTKMEYMFDVVQKFIDS